MKATFRARKSPFIRKFTKTPKGIVCPHFWIVGWAKGCPYQCAYCFLQGTYKGWVEPELFTNMVALEKEVRRHFNRPEPTVLNTGELSDGLWKEDEVGLLDYLLPLFDDKLINPYGHKLLILTKSINIQSLLGWVIDNERPPDNVIISFSVNAFDVSERYEKGAPSTEVRLHHAKQLHMAGYPIRLRIDPIIPDDGLGTVQQMYADLVDHIFKSFTPERITLGSLRFFPTVKSFAKKLGRNLRVFDFVKRQEDPDGRARLPFDQRLSLYKYIIDRIDRRSYSGICKETVELHKAMRGYHRYQRFRCNCVG